MRRNGLALSTAIAALLGTLATGARAAGGDTCAGATTITTLPYTHASGNSCGFENDVTNSGPAACPDLPGTYPGPDVFYKIVLGTGNDVAFSLTMPSDATGDLALFLIDEPSCSSTGTCAANSVDVKGAGQGPERIKSASYPPGTYYVVVDSVIAQGMSGSCGAYTLSVTGIVGTVTPSMDAGAPTDGGPGDTGAGAAPNGGTGGGGASSVQDASTSTDAGSTETGGNGAGGAGAGGTAAAAGATSASGGASGANTGGNTAITDAGLAGSTADASTSGASSSSGGCGCTIDASGRATPAGLSAVALALALCARRRRRRAVQWAQQ